MPREKPKATPAQPQPSDDLDKWIDSACENDPIEVVEFIDDEIDGLPSFELEVLARFAAGVADARVQSPSPS